MKRFFGLTLCEWGILGCASLASSLVLAAACLAEKNSIARSQAILDGKIKVPGIEVGQF